MRGRSRAQRSGILQMSSSTDKKHPMSFHESSILSVDQIHTPSSQPSGPDCWSIELQKNIPCLLACDLDDDPGRLFDSASWQACSTAQNSLARESVKNGPLCYIREKTTADEHAIFLYILSSIDEAHTREKTTTRDYAKFLHIPSSIDEVHYYLKQRLTQYLLSMLCCKLSRQNLQ